ncbi:hypothetical protein IKF27_03385, partial [Candidatus Saccharibacteria bacterium]|nr:hypothetical protein [Candidatus Saccharibacteria bacterium]
MTRRKHEIRNFFSKYFAYLLSFALIIAVAYFGSRGKESIGDGSTNIQVIFSNNYTVTADQVSEFYVVSEIANAMQLAGR